MDETDTNDNPTNDSSSSASQLVGLFSPPPPATPGRESLTERNSTEHVSNERTFLLQDMFRHPDEKEEQQLQDGDTPTKKGGTLSSSTSSLSSSLFWQQPQPQDHRRSSVSSIGGGIVGDDAFSNLKELRHPESSDYKTNTPPPTPLSPMNGNEDKTIRTKTTTATSTTSPAQASSSLWHKLSSLRDNHPIIKAILQPTTIAGSAMFLLYHVVFTLAFGSALMRPHANDNGGSSVVGIMAKQTAVAIFGAGPFYIARLNTEIPAIYPSCDLFLAPFIAEAAAIVDTSLWEQYGKGPYPDALFFGSLAVLSSIGMAIAGLFLWLGSNFKLANLGAYLPYSVLSGFFSAVGVLMWCLAFSVDTSGKTWKKVFFSGDGALITHALIHHLPSLVIGILMNKLGPKNPFFVILLIVVTIVVFYATMFITGTSLQEAQENGWFWSTSELVYDHRDSAIDGQEINLHSTPGVFQGGADGTTEIPQWMLPPAPFGSFAAILAGHVNWTAVMAGISNMTALAFLYLLRSSIHASAMKKNVSNLVMRIPVSAADRRNGSLPSPTTVHRNVLQRVSDSVRIVNMSMKNKKPQRNHQNGNRNAVMSSPDNEGYVEIRAKAPQRSLESIFSEYSYALFAVSLVGGYGVCPTVATSNTMYAIGADGPAPQYGSILLLVIFYLLDFRMVEYIPKTAFSSLLVLGAVDTMVVWFFGAFRKTQDLSEWLVVPVIAACSLFVGFLNAVFLGIGISMFVFVASFFRIGVVKYNATGLEIRSRIERSIAQSTWLSENGDLCQVIVLQNYLFFGNAISVLNYISTMFEEVDPSEASDYSIPPFPKIVVVDLSLVTGMDTSTVDIFAEIHEFCKNRDCKLFLCGLSLRMRKGLELGGVKPQSGLRSESSVRFFSDLDTALGRAEDYLIKTEMSEDTPRPIRSSRSNESLEGIVGFRQALRQIDELHGLDFTHKLLGLQNFTHLLELQPGECLYQCDGGVIEDSRRGLFFIEEGLLKIERDSSQSLTWTRTLGSIGNGSKNLAPTAAYTLKNQHARMGSVARRASQAKGRNVTPQSNLRLARIGPGWISGTLDMGAGIRSSGIAVAVTKCRLHHLPFDTLEQIEQDNPALVLSLYKLVTHLRAYREEATIEQLTTLNNIMTSPAHSKPLSRAARHALGP